MHHFRPSTRAALLAGALALVLAPDAAHAQLGGLKRRLGEKVGRAVLGEEPAARSAAPAFSDRVLQIDDARFDQLLRGLRVEAAEAQKSERAQAAENAKMAEQEKKNEAYAGCSEPYAKELLRYTGMTMGLALAAKREQDRTGKVGGPMQDSLQVVTARMMKVTDDMVAKCGEGPKESSFDAVSDSEGTDPEALGARASGLKAEQYAVLRERAAAFLQARGGSTGSYVYAAGERALLERRASELAPFRKLLG
jgi:hypothetical protein